MQEQGCCEWKPVEVNPETSTLPCARSGHSLVVVGRRAVCFGGCADSNDAPALLNDSYALDLNDPNNPRWSKMDVDESTLPPARWRHTGTAIDDNNMLVWGGIGEKTRYNDTYVLDMSDETAKWHERKPDGNPPAPRSYHTATLIGLRLYIFGGYGGHGQRRQFFDDLHILDLDLNKWLGQEDGLDAIRDGGIRLEGTGPGPRGNHTTSIIDKTLLCVMGGRDSTQYFGDTHILDTETLTWSQVSTYANPSAPTRLCSHLAAGIQSVPSSYLFAYGGQTSKDKSRTEWSYRDKVDVLDCRSMTWMAAPRLVLGDAPAPREDAAWAFDGKTSKLIMFGGWANDWLDDCHMLDVSGIVGPPYAVQSLEPDEGPMTGRSKLIIHGLDFVKGKCVVKFTDGRNEELSEKADVVSPTEIHCLSPDWSKYAPGEVNVRVSIGGDAFSVNKVKWVYYTNTKPQKCVAFGPGLFDKGVVWGFPALFKIQAKDTGGRNRTSGGEADLWRISATTAEGVELPIKIVDNKDGTYDVSYIPRGAGTVDINAAYDDVVQGGVIPIRGSPWKASFENPWSKVKNIQNAPKVTPGLTATTLQKKVVFYGGGPDVHVLDCGESGPKWEQIEVSGDAPPSRVQHSMVTLDNEKILISGGRSVPPVPDDDKIERDRWGFTEESDKVGQFHPFPVCLHVWYLSHPCVSVPQERTDLNSKTNVAGRQSKHG